MSNLERLYYEDDSFWAGKALQDDGNVKRIKFTAGLVPEDVLSLVDVGCGNGVFVNYLSTIKPQLDIVGVDRSERALTYVKTQKLWGDIAEIPLGDHSYDCVTCLEVLEHLPISVYHSAISELTRLSKKYIIVSVPFEENLEEYSNQCPRCKTIFNLNLHLRSFNDEALKSLFEEIGFVCRKIDHLGESRRPLFHYQYRRIFYPEQFRKFESPICPLCGYAGDKRHENTALPEHKASFQRKLSLKKRVLSTLSTIPRIIWPKETKYYWVIALFEKVSATSD